MTTIGMHYDVKPGKEEEFEQGFLKTLDVLRTLPGHVESHLYEDVASVGSYVILSQWARKEDFDAFLRSDAFKAAVAWGRAEILRSRPRHRVFTEDAAKGAGAAGGAA
jgi:heme-degrading monooxygenase HmoA